MLFFKQKKAMYTLHGALSCNKFVDKMLSHLSHYLYVSFVLAIVNNTFSRYRYMKDAKIRLFTSSTMIALSYLRLDSMKIQKYYHQYHIATYDGS